MDKTKNIDLKSDKKTFNKIMFSEMGSCFSITFLLLLLNTLIISHHPLAYWITIKDNSKISNVMIGLYVFLVVLFTIVIFERWSCNANPTISLYFWLSKKCDGKNTMYKIIFQFIGAIIAGALAMAIVNGTDPNNIYNHDGDFTGFAIQSVFAFGKENTLPYFFSGTISIICVEFFAAIGICWSLTSNNIKPKFKLWSVLIYLFIAPAAAATTGVLSFNPARAFGPAIFHDIQVVFIWKSKLTIYNSELLTYPLFIIAPFCGALVYYKFTLIYDDVILPKWEKIIGKKIR